MINNQTNGQPHDLDVIPEPEHPTKTSKLVNWIVIGALVVVALGLLRIFTWSFDNTQVLTVKNSPFPTRIINDKSAGGSGVIILTADYCKNKNIQGDLRISFVSPSREVFLPVAKEQGPVGCNKTDVPVLIPKDLSPDTYRIKFRVTYDKNPLKQNEVVEFESQPVQVAPTQ